jgi:hypothetical protein
MQPLKDALYNLHPDSGSSAEYAKGVLVGAVAAIMEVKGCDWEAAMGVVWPHLPEKVRYAAMPATWTLGLGDRIVYDE